MSDLTRDLTYCAVFTNASSPDVVVAIEVDSPEDTVAHSSSQVLISFPGFSNGRRVRLRKLVVLCALLANCILFVPMFGIVGLL